MAVASPTPPASLPLRVLCLLALHLHAALADDLSPCALVPTTGGSAVYVAEATAGQVARVDLASGRLTQVIPVPGSPSGLALSPDGAYLFVTTADVTGRVLRVSTASPRVDVLPAIAHTLVAPALSPDGRTLFVCSRFENTVLVLDAATGVVRRRTPVLREPVAAGLTPDGTRLFVANHLPTGPSTGSVVAASVTLLDTADGAVVRHVRLPNGATAVRGLCVSPDGQYVYVTHTLARFQAPATQLERGWMTTSALSILDATDGHWINSVLLDEFDRGAANPWGVACSPDGRFLAIAQAGTHDVSLIDRLALHERLARAGRGEQTTAFATNAACVSRDLTFLAGIRRRVSLTGNGPRAVAWAGPRLVAAEYFSDSLGLLEGGLADVRSIRLGPPPVPPTPARRGEMLFNDATLCYQQWQSCATCHPDGRADGLNWDLLNDGIGNPKNTKNMVYAHRTPPAMVSGIRETAEVAVRSGFRFIQFHEASEPDARAVDAYLKSLEPVPSPLLQDGQLTEQARRGRRVFEQAGCAKCHPQPLFTDLKSYSIGLTPAAVVTQRFDTSTLIENWRTAPYLYDGRAATLEDVLIRHNPRDLHGRTRSLAPDERAALVEYLLSL